MKTISIAIATYNGGLYLREQLDSILNQTIPFHEIVISDDASVDSTWSILTDYAQKDQRIRLYRNEQNLGFVKNFEQALRYCTSDFIALSDQDDVWCPDHLQILLEGLGDKMCVVGEAELTNSAGFPSGHKLSFCCNLDFIPENDLKKAYFLFYHCTPYQGASMMFRRDFLEKALPIPQGVLFHDTWFFALACFYGGLQPLQKTVTLYRRHNKAISGLKMRRPKFFILISHLLLGRALRYRPMMIPPIRDRVDNLNEAQIGFLKCAEKYYNRRKTLGGRLANLIFDLKHYKLI